MLGLPACFLLSGRIGTIFFLLSRERVSPVRAAL